MILSVTFGRPDRIMKDGAVEQCDTPDKIVLEPATEYVRKFTEEIEKSRVVHAGVLADAGASGERLRRAEQFMILPANSSMINAI